MDPHRRNRKRPRLSPLCRFPVGWKRVEDDRLSFSLAVLFPWLTFYLHSDAANPIAVLLSGERAVEILRDFLSTLEGRNLGILAFERDSLQLYAFRQNSAEEFNEPDLHSLLTGFLNRVHALQASTTANLSSLEYWNSPCLVVTALRANVAAHILTTATRERTAVARQPTVGKIVSPFLPEVPTNTPASAIAGVVEPGT